MMNQMFDVSGRVVIVTGSNRGNGYAIASGVRKAGATIIRIDLSFDNEMESHDIELDLSDIAKIGGVVQEIENKYGRIDGLINNAGISLQSDDPYSDDYAFNKTISVNLTAAFEMCKKVCPIMAKNKYGSVINITSLGAERGFPDNPAYQMSKGGLKQLTKALARDWAKFNIRANNICPGYIKTNMTEKSFNDKRKNAIRTNNTLMQRWGVPEDLVGPAVFLISDASSYITGTDLYVDGGWMANGGI